MDYKNTVTWKEINETPEIFNNLKSSNSDTIKEIVSAIKGSNNTNFVAVGRGASNHALVYFKYLLEVMSNYTVGLSAPSIVTLYRGKINYSNSIIIGCSQSGKAEDVLEVIRRGNEQGALTIAVTNDSDSPIGQEAKFVLNCNAGEQLSSIATKTFNAELYLLLWIALELARDKDKLFLLKNIGLDLEHVFSILDKESTKVAEMFCGIEHGFVLSRGLAYSVALELSLLMQETCSAQVMGYSSSDFCHGPLAMVNENTPVLIFCPKTDGEDEELQTIIRADQIKNIEKVLSLKAPVVLVTNDIILTGRFKKCNDVLIPFSMPEEFSMFAFTIFAQMLSCKISCLKGLNPDNPRGIDRNISTK